MRHSVQHIYKSSQQGDSLLYAWFTAMHTRVDIVIHGWGDEKELMDVIYRIEEALRQLEGAANFYDPESELAKINRIGALHPVKISSDLYKMIESCLAYNTQTFGCFDVTIHSEQYNRDSIHSVRLSADDQTVFFKKQGTVINLSGFLKGYALEKIRSILQAHTIENALVNMGNSSVLALGSAPGGNGWKIGFGNQAESTDNAAEVCLYNECLTTSGNDSNTRKHIISPHTNRLVEGKRQLAVVTEDGITGEVLSTSLFVADSTLREAMIRAFAIKTIIEL